MISGPGGLLGLPPGVPSPTWDVAWWRDLLVLAALAAAWCEGRARRVAAFTFALLFAVLAIGFWVAALARPYGVLVDAPTTAWAADVSVAGSGGGTDGFLAGEPAVGSVWTFLAGHLPVWLVLLLPTLLPLAVVPAAAVVIAAGWGRREALLAAIFWIGAATSALDAARGAGFLTLLWSRPLASIAWVATVAVVFLLSRRGPQPLGAVLGAAVVMSWMGFGHGGPELGLADTIWALTLDGHLWFVLGVLGLRWTHDSAAGALAAGGALLALVRAAGGPGDVWAGAAFCRLGLVLAATVEVEAAAPLVAARLSERGRTLLAGGGLVPERWPQAATVALVLGGGLLAWWDPVRTDPLARASLEPVSETLVEAMQWLRGHTGPDAVILADDDYAPAIAVLAGRRVLRAPGLVTAPDDERRVRLERAVLSGRLNRPLVQRYGLRYVFIAPGQFRSEGIVEPEDLDRMDALRLAYENAKGMRVYEILPGAHAPAAGRRPERIE